MRFYDEITIHVQSGQGGNGVVTGRREMGVPHGWPSGGNGGKWWSIILKASKDENTLLAYRYKAIFKGKAGEPGRSKDQYGANADDITLVVPVGTLIRDKLSGHLLYAFTKDGEERTAVEWGEWGVGNMHFKDAVNQYPNFSLLGEPGHTKDIVLELQLLADVALIGAPSVGKSSIINSISNTKAKVADYPFTTLVPNLWSVKQNDQTFNVIDIPGLIKWAAEGKGLGNAFLRHILKSRVFCLVLDMARYDTGVSEAIDLLEEIFQYIQIKFDPDLTDGIEEMDIDIQADGKMITLFAYHDGKVVLEKRLLFVVNKYDLVNDKDILQEYFSELKKQILHFFQKKNIWKTITSQLLDTNLFALSAATHVGIEEWLQRVVQLLQKTKPEDVYHLENIPTQVYDGQKIEMIREADDSERQILLDQWLIDPGTYDYAKIREIRHPEICKMVRMTWRWNPEAENHFWKEIHHKGFLETLEMGWINKGDILKIVSYYAGKEDRYIVY